MNHCLQKDAARVGQGHRGRSDRNPVVGWSHVCVMCGPVSVGQLELHLWALWCHREPSSLLGPAALVRGHLSVSGGLSLGSVPLPFIPLFWILESKAEVS